jgi:hypothetical protein
MDKKSLLKELLKDYKPKPLDKSSADEIIKKFPDKLKYYDYIDDAHKLKLYDIIRYYNQETNRLSIGLRINKFILEHDTDEQNTDSEYDDGDIDDDYEKELMNMLKKAGLHKEKTEEDIKNEIKKKRKKMRPQVIENEKKRIAGKIIHKIKLYDISHKKYWYIKPSKYIIFKKPNKKDIETKTWLEMCKIDIKKVDMDKIKV